MKEKGSNVDERGKRHKVRINEVSGKKERKMGQEGYSCKNEGCVDEGRGKEGEGEG